MSSRTVFKKRGVWVTRYVTDYEIGCDCCGGTIPRKTKYHDLQLGATGAVLCAKCWPQVQVATAIVLGQEP